MRALGWLTNNYTECQRLFRSQWKTCFVTGKVQSACKQQRNSRFRKFVLSPFDLKGESNRTIEKPISQLKKFRSLLTTTIIRITQFKTHQKTGLHNLNHTRIHGTLVCHKQVLNSVDVSSLLNCPVVQHMWKISVPQNLLLTSGSTPSGMTALEYFL